VYGLSTSRRNSAGIADLKYTTRLLLRLSPIAATFAELLSTAIMSTRPVVTICFGQQEVDGHLSVTTPPTVAQV